MNVIIDNVKDLNSIIKVIQDEDFLAIDTEFIRETTYFSKLCLIQIATKNISFIIDPLSNNITLEPLWEILNKKQIIKVMHSGRQDMEIFYNATGMLPSPVYDTQVAAMVCGFGDQVSYENLVKNLLNIAIDKSSRVSDWSFRPLSNKQISYALADVTYLIKIYEILKKKISKNKRNTWIKEEMYNFTNIKNYQIKPDEAWKKIKLKSTKKDFLNRVKFIAEWRELYSIKKNIPKNRTMRDDTLLDIASNNPKNIQDFKRVRGLNINSKKEILIDILGVLKTANKVPEKFWPEQTVFNKNKSSSPATLELLKVILKHVAEEQKVAPKLLASQKDLELISDGVVDNLLTFKGWRHEIFGKLALDLSAGKMAIKVRNKKIQLIKVD
mgnify:CR=1 FL=1